MQTVIDDILTNYQILGPTNSKTILILHGWGQNLNNWMYLAHKLAGNFKVALVDLPGFGSSSLPKSAYGVADYSQFVSDFTKKIKLTDFYLLGHSFGGKVAIDFASKSPSAIKLFLVSPSGIDKKTLSVRVKIALSKTFKRLFHWFSRNWRVRVAKIFA
jgi:pimeloyl-ACP methyl ester carboxylesterase